MMFGNLSGAPTGALASLTALFDHLPDVVFFVKDRDSRYLAVNQTLVSRSPLAGRSDIVGKSSREVFPGPLGVVFHEQDRRVIASGVGFHDCLELHLHSRGGRGWCVTCKEPVFDPDGRVVGLCGLSRDLPASGDDGGNLEGVSAVLEHIHRNFGEPLRLADLAAMAGLSVYQLNERIRGMFRVTAGQYVMKVRIDAGCRMLALSSEPIVEIALACGYSDQSSFSRQFKQAVGMTPKAYRLRAWSSGGATESARPATPAPRPLSRRGS